MAVWPAPTASAGFGLLAFQGHGEDFYFAEGFQFFFELVGGADDDDVDFGVVDVLVHDLLDLVEGDFADALGVDVVVVEGVVVEDAVDAALGLLPGGLHLHEHAAGGAEFGVGEFFFGDGSGLHVVEDFEGGFDAVDGGFDLGVGADEEFAALAGGGEHAVDAVGEAAFGADVAAEAGVDAGGEDLAGEGAGEFVIAGDVVGADAHADVGLARLGAVDEHDVALGAGDGGVNGGGFGGFGGGPVGEEFCGEFLAVLDGDVAGEDHDGVGGVDGVFVEGFDIIEGDGLEGLGHGGAAERRVAEEGVIEFIFRDSGGGVEGDHDAAEHLGFELGEFGGVERGVAEHFAGLFEGEGEVLGEAVSVEAGEIAATGDVEGDAAGFEEFIEGVVGGSGGSAADHGGSESAEAGFFGGFIIGSAAGDEGEVDDGEAAVGHDDDFHAADDFFDALFEGGGGDGSGEGGLGGVVGGEIDHLGSDGLGAGLGGGGGGDGGWRGEGGFGVRRDEEGARAFIAEIFFGDALDVGGGDGVDALLFGADAGEISAEEHFFADFAGDFVGGFPAFDEFEAGGHFGLGQFFGGDGLIAQGGDLCAEDFFDVGGVFAVEHHGGSAHDAAVFEVDAEGVGLGAERGGAGDECLNEAAGASFAEDGEHYAEGVLVVVDELGRRVADHEAGEGDAHGDFVAAGFFLLGLGRGDAGDGGAFGDPCEVFADGFADGFDVDVAGDDEDGVVGDVVGVEEVLQFLGGGGAEVVHVADGGPVVVMFREDFGEHFFPDGAVGLVLAEAPFFGDDEAFGGENFGGDAEAGHAVGFEPEGEFDVGGGDGVDVDGLVEAGVGVGVAADGLDEFHVFFGFHVGGAAEHHVFEHVSEALAIGAFIFGADVVEDFGVDDGRGFHGGVDDLEAVGEGFGFEGDGLGAGEGGEDEEGK